MKKIYTCTDHDNHYPVGVASVITADDETDARYQLDYELKKDGLKPYSEKPYTLVEIDLSDSQAIILCNGNY